MRCYTLQEGAAQEGAFQEGAVHGATVPYACVQTLCSRSMLTQWEGVLGRIWSGPSRGLRGIPNGDSEWIRR